MKAHGATRGNQANLDDARSESVTANRAAADISRRTF